MYGRTNNALRRNATNNPLYAAMIERVQRPLPSPAYNAADHKHLYQTKWWWRARAIMRRDHPWCVFCASKGLQVRMKMVDHKTPHRGNPALFFNFNNLQSLCLNCHNSVKAALERNRGGADIDGNPLNPQEGW